MLQDIKVDHFAENEYFSECCIKIYFCLLKRRQIFFVWMDIFLLNLANWKHIFNLISCSNFNFTLKGRKSIKSYPSIHLKY